MIMASILTAGLLSLPHSKRYVHAHAYSNGCPKQGTVSEYKLYKCSNVFYLNTPIFSMILGSLDIQGQKEIR